MNRIFFFFVYIIPSMEVHMVKVCQGYYTKLLMTPPALAFHHGRPPRNGLQDLNPRSVLSRFIHDKPNSLLFLDN